MDGGSWKAAVHGVAEGWAWLSDFTFTSHFNALEKEMATHSSVLAWRISGMAEPGGLPSMGSHGVGYDWCDLAAAAAAGASASCHAYLQIAGLTSWYAKYLLCFFFLLVLKFKLLKDKDSILLTRLSSTPRAQSRCSGSFCWMNPFFWNPIDLNS